MDIQIIRGAIGSGKTSYIFQSIKQKLCQNGRRQVIVVPEQFSYETERLAAEHFGGTGLNNAEVMTPSRLVSRYMQHRQKNRLTPSGKMMIIYRAVNSLCEENIYFGCAKKPGFLESAAEMVSEFVEYMITPDILRAKAEEIQNKLLSEKLFAAAELLEEYIRLSEGFCDSEEDLLALAEYAEDSGCFWEYDFWFDEFSVFLPQHYRLMQAFLKNGSEIHISVCIDSDGRELYDVNRIMLNKIMRLAETTGAEVSEYKTDDVCRSIHSPEMLFLLNNIDNINSPDFQPWEDATSDISVFVCKDLYKEVRHTALQIRKLVMEEGFRYRDIAVVCGNTDAYSHLIEAVFTDFGIPYFSDTRLSAAEHPISTLLISVFDIVADNWSYASVFRFLRTGFFFVKTPEGEVVSPDSDGIDLLENYVLKYGVRGKNVWLEDEKWENSQKGFFDALLSDGGFLPEELEKINSMRAMLIAPFKNLYEKIAGKRTVRELCEAVFEFFGEIHLYEGLSQKSAEFDAMALRNESEQFCRIWNIIIETLDQCVVVMGDEKCSRENFSGLLSAGLSAVDISIIPSGLDRVSVSSVERSRQQDPKVMLIMGAVFGAIPRETVSSGILTDTDRAVLREELLKDGLEIAAESEVRNDMDRFNFFSTLFGVSQKVYITYPAADAEGNTQRPAAIITDLFRVFPSLSSGDDIVAEDTEKFLYSPRAAYRYMLENRGKGELAESVYDWYRKNMPERLDVIKEASQYKKADARITPESAKRLYSDRNRYSISRLNEYGKCPFCYFVKYGLGAKEQEIRTIRKFDLGSIMHMALEMYCKRVDKDAETFEQLRKNWLSLSEEESRKLAASIMKELEEKILSGAVRDENKLRYIIMRMARMVERSVEAVRKSLASGEYAAVCYEQKFRVEVSWGGKAVPVDGVIDRVDLAEVADKKIAELRVADYKTGRKEFSVISICNKQDIQLIMYAVAAVEMYKSGVIKYARADYEPRMRAVLYNRMHDDLTEGVNEEEAKKAQVMASRPDGLVVLDGDGECYDISAAVRMDGKLAPSAESEVLRIKLKADSNVASGSRVTSSDAFGLLMDYVKKSVIEADNEIFDGIIKIYPACGKDGSACDWCGFEEVCLYNKKFDSARMLVNDEDSAWEIIKGEVMKSE